MILLLAVAFPACTKYERQVVPFKLPSAFPNATEAADATIAAKSYDEKDEAGKDFGFFIIASAGGLDKYWMTKEGATPPRWVIEYTDTNALPSFSYF